MVDFTDSGRKNVNCSWRSHTTVSISLLEQLAQLQAAAEHILQNVEDGTIPELNVQLCLGRKLCNDILEKNPEFFEKQYEFIEQFFKNELNETSNRGALLMTSACVVNALGELIHQQKQATEGELNLLNECFPEMKRRG